MKVVIKKIGIFLFSLVYRLIRLTGLIQCGVAKNIIQVIEADQKKFITYHCRPIRSVEIETRADNVKNTRKLAIVIQGPVLRDNDFTLETTKLYKKHFPRAIIILSTWEEESPETIKEFGDLGIEVILNEKPDYVGVSNINLQIVSSGSGVSRAHELGAKYAMKTRTDQRMYAPNAGEFLYNITETFPINCPKQKERIVGMSLNTFKYRLYGLSDMFTYGHIDDMLLYWNPDLDQRVMAMTDGIGDTPRKFSQLRLCEVYLATEFLAKIGREMRWSLKDSWQVFADHFCVVDKEQLDLFWPKYNRLEYPQQTYTVSRNSKQELTFRDWLNIYFDLNNIEIHEDILDE
jgi:hypothetical protein